MNELEKFEKSQIQKALGERKIPEFSPGDTVRVNVKIIEIVYSEKEKKEEKRERIQAYEGVCIARSGKGINQSFTVRKISYGEGVERIFPLFSPRIESIEVVRRGDVRRAKLYYLRDRSGKSARITERTDGHGMNEGKDITDEAANTPVATPPKKKAVAG